MTISQLKQDALLDELLQGGTNPKDILGEHRLLRQLQKCLVERVLEVELTHHLGYEPNGRGGNGVNSCNGKTKKVVQTDTAQLEIEVPRDRDASFEPQMVKKCQRRLPGFDEKVLAF